MLKKNTIFVLIFLLSLNLLSAVDAPVVVEETKEQKDERMGWWREARFGMFIHWGLYCVPAGVYNGQPIGGLGEWIMHNAKIPIDFYAKYASQFNPVKFDAEAWVKIAQNAGVKYIVITAKHHEGFAMFHTKVDDYNLYDASPFKRDPIKELADACHKAGIRFGLYYSQNLDWHHPGGGGGEWDPSHQGDPDQYVKNIVVPQVKEILSNYGEISVIWWDIPGGVINKERADLIYQTVKGCAPNIIMNNRLGGGYKGDTETPEQKIPPRGYPGRDWETCMTINNTWGYKTDDKNFKSTETLLRNLIDIASKGGNYLLNIGPTAEGLIPPEEIQRLSEVGQWLKVNGESIYGSSATAFGDESGSFSTTELDKNGKPAFKASWSWRCTTKPGKYYIHLFSWPNGKFTLNAVKKNVTNAYLLADPARKPLPIEQAGESLKVSLPAQAPDPIDSVLVLETKE